MSEKTKVVIELDEESMTKLDRAVRIMQNAGRTDVTREMLLVDGGMHLVDGFLAYFDDVIDAHLGDHSQN